MLWSGLRRKSATACVLHLFEGSSRVLRRSIQYERDGSNNCLDLYQFYIQNKLWTLRNLTADTTESWISLKIANSLHHNNRWNYLRNIFERKTCLQNIVFHSLLFGISYSKWWTISIVWQFISSRFHVVPYITCFTTNKLSLCASHC